VFKLPYLGKRKVEEGKRIISIILFRCTLIDNCLPKCSKLTNIALAVQHLDHSSLTFINFVVSGSLVADEAVSPTHSLTGNHRAIRATLLSWQLKFLLFLMKP